MWSHLRPQVTAMKLAHEQQPPGIGRFQQASHHPPDGRLVSLQVSTLPENKGVVDWWVGGKKGRRRQPEWRKRGYYPKRKMPNIVDIKYPLLQRNNSHKRLLRTVTLFSQ